MPRIALAATVLLGDCSQTPAVPTTPRTATVVNPDDPQVVLSRCGSRGPGGRSGRSRRTRVQPGQSVRSKGQADRRQARRRIHLGTQP